MRVAAEVGSQQRLVQRLQRIAGHDVSREPEIERVGGADACAREAEVEPGLAREPGQEVRGTDIGEEPDPGFRHGEEGALGHHAVRAVDRDSDAAPHDDAVDQRDIGLRVAEDEGVEAVFLRVEDRGEVAVRIVLLAVKKADVAAGAEGHAPVVPRGSAHDHRRNRRVLRPFLEPGIEAQHHGLGQRVQRLRPVQRHAADPALPFQENFVAHGGSAPVNCRRILRTTPRRGNSCGAAPCLTPTAGGAR